MNASISFAVICAIVALGSQIYSIWNNHNKNVEETKREKIELEKNLLKLDIKLDNVNGQINTLVKNYESTNVEIKNMNESIIKFGEQLKSVWREVEDHENRITNIEKEVIKP